MDDSLREFSQLLAQSTDGGFGGSIDLLLAQMEPPHAEELRLCAIPHEVDTGLIASLLPGATGAGINAAYSRLASVSFVLPTTDGKLVLHDHARTHLFATWLTDAHLPVFRAASARLAEYFAKLAVTGTNVALEAAASEHVYHLIGADQERGFEVFDELVRERFRQYRLNDCSGLLKRVHEYDRVLTEMQSQLIRYHEARLAADLANEKDARRLLEELLGRASLLPELEVRARKRLGVIYLNQRKWTEALAQLDRALAIARSTSALANVVDDVLHDIGCARRDMGDARGAEQTFELCINLAKEQNDTATLAIAYNSLGTLWQRLGDATRAIAMFEQSLEYLRLNDEPFRPAQVYNNLAMAYAELREWGKGEEMLQRSLEIKRAAGDTRGQALALSNLMRIYLNRQQAPRAIEVAEEATALFCRVKDYHRAAQVQNNLGRLLETLGDDERAQAAFAQANELQQSADGAARTSSHPLVASDSSASSAPRRRMMAVIFVSILFILVLYVGKALFG